MKRCPQCDFIYEDEQHLCDMDGYELVYEPNFQPLPISGSHLSTKPPVQLVKSARRRLMLWFAIVFLLGTALFVGYSGFTSKFAPQTIKSPSTNVIKDPQPPPDHVPVTPTVSPGPSPSRSPKLENKRVTSLRVTPLIAPRVMKSTPLSPFNCVQAGIGGTSYGNGES
ncbi:hypothetical protein BH20ACI3_BH20ACI3_34730 [soil metagenome]